MQDYWIKQAPNTPAFPDIEWSRPQNIRAAGKLLIIGGNAHGFIDVGMSYQNAIQAGAGTVRVLLPDILQKTVGRSIDTTEFAASTPSGSFSKAALNELLIHAEWADAVLLAGEFGRNSETAVLLESFVQKYNGPLTITRDAIDYFFQHTHLILDRPNTCIVASLGQLQRLAINSHFPHAITTSLDLIKLVEVLRDFESQHCAFIITHQSGTTYVAANKRVSTTKNGTNEEIWRVPTAAWATVYWLQNLQKAFEAITSSLLKLS